MTNSSFKTARLAATFALVAALAACGGGGGSSPAAVPVPAAPAPSPAPAPAPVTTGDLGTTIQPSTYTAGSVGALTYQDLNVIRQAGGFGTLAQSSASALDAAAQNQADYAVANYSVVDPSTGGLTFDTVNHLNDFYSQTQGVGVFVGANPVARAVAFGYQITAPLGSSVASLQEVAGFAYSNGDAATDASNCVENGLAATAQRVYLLDPRYRDVGIGFAGFSQQQLPAASGGFYQVACYLNVAAHSTDYSATGQATAPSGWSGIYPPDQSTVTRMVNLSNAVHGFAPSVTVDSQLTLTTTSFVITDPTGAVVPTQLNLDVPALANANWAFATPTAPLAPSTTYTVKFVGSAGSSPIVRTWSFTTPAQ